MSTIVVTSVSGAPGVTTTAIGLGRVWPQSSLVVEDDTHHAMLAGYLRAGQHAEPNLATVASLTSTPTNAQTVWESIARPLPTDDPVSGLRRKVILGPPTPWSRAGIDPRWGFMLGLWRRLEEAGIDTIIDLGRLATPLTSTPQLIAGSVDQLVSRLDGRMEPREAFQRMADELDSSEADAVLASLALAATHPRGASVTLKAIAGTIQQRLKVLRQVEAERSKPRNAVRQITLVTIAMFGVLLVVGRSFLAPLATPPGQVLVTAAVVMYVTALVQMYRMARPRRRTRIMVRRTR